ncbi:hypothetical protein MUG78_17960 [Gordonia alkaliphila]|uniref:hypothetical protein n=1 Tax=Gordonia alkaliphila TaxID=1053547 RepID=UPI001FF4C83B|nr:hypothetical protein [Gordonia alkaliphila]MCK0441288.1 hypothetical protein [Gordonia alkaliphila]
MKPWDFWTEWTVPAVDPLERGTVEKVLDTDKLDAIVAGPLPDYPDVETAVALARFVHEQYESYGTNCEDLVTDDESLTILRTLKALLNRLGITTFDPPFRDFKSFRSYWIRNDCSGSWQARRDVLDEIFEPLHRVLDEREAGSISSTLATAISPRKVTGWPRVDEEISELRRHFESASTQQDYSNVGNDCVSTLEALSEAAYDHAKHGSPGEDEPPVAKTKDRLDRVVEVGLVGPENAHLRKLARAAIELAQAVKHRRETATRAEAGIAADAVILLANMIRRLGS